VSLKRGRFPQIKYPVNRLRIITTLITQKIEPHLQELLLKEALLTIFIKKNNAFDLEVNPSEELQTLFTSIEKPLLEKLITYMNDINNEKNRVFVLIELLPYLSQSQLNQVIVLSRKIESKEERVNLLSAIITFLPEPKRLKTLIEVTKIAKEINTKSTISFSNHVMTQYYIVEILQALPKANTKLFTDEAAQEAINEVRKIKNTIHIKKILGTLASHFSKKMSKKLNFIAIKINDQDDLILSLKILIGYLKKTQTNELLMFARGLDDNFQCAKELCNLLTIFPQLQKNNIFIEIFNYLQAISQEECQKITLWGKKLFNRERKIIEVLIDLLDYLPETMQIESLIVAQIINVNSVLGKNHLEFWQYFLKEGFYDLKKLIPKLKQSLQKKLILEFYENNKSIEAITLITELFQYIDKSLRDQMLKQIFNEAKQNKEKENKLKTMATIAYYLTERQLEKIIADVQALEDIGTQAEIHALLAKNLKEPQKSKFINQTIVFFLKTNSSELINRYLQSVTNHIPKSLLLKIIAKIHLLKNKNKRIQLFMLMVQLISERENAVRSFSCEKSVYPYLSEEKLEDLSEEKLEDIFEDIHLIDNSEITNNYLKLIMPYLDKALLLKIIDRTHLLNDKSERAKLFILIIQHITESNKSELIKEAFAPELLDEIFEDIQLIDNNSEIISNYIKLIMQHLDKFLLLKVIGRTRLLNDKSERAKLFILMIQHISQSKQSELLEETIKPYITEKQLEEIFDEIKQIDNNTNQLNIQLSLVKYMQEPQKTTFVNKVLLTILKDSNFDLYEHLRIIMPHLSEFLLFRALVKIQKSSRAELLLFIYHHISESKRNEILEKAVLAVMEIPYNIDKRYDIVSKLATELSKLPQPDMFKYYRKIFNTTQISDRRKLLKNISDYSSLLFELGGETAIGDTFKSIQEIGQWWQ